MKKLLLIVALFAPLGATAQTWHGHAVQPGSTTPQCLVEDDTDLPGFVNCRSIVDGDDYLKAHNVIIWTPEGYKNPRPGKGFWLLEAAAIGAGIADEERTQHLLHEAPTCNAAGVCFQYREADPLLGHTRAQAYSVLGAIDVADLLIGWKMQRYESLRSSLGLPAWRRGWQAWLYNYRVPLVAQIALHGIAVERTWHKIL